MLSEQISRLTVHSEISGVVTTPRLRDHIGTFLPAGSMIAEIANVAQLRARIYVPEYDLHNIRLPQSVSLMTDGDPTRLHTNLETVLPTPVAENDPLLPKQEFRGAHVPRFFVAIATVENADSRLRPGQTGIARIFIARWSIAGMLSETVESFLKGKFW